jgi:hypothetical protein
MYHRSLGYVELEHARANVFQIGAGVCGDSTGRHPPCFSESGVIVTDCTQGTPSQSFPAGIAFAAEQPPSQLFGGSNDVCATSEPSSAQLAAAAVSIRGG